MLDLSYIWASSSQNALITEFGWKNIMFHPTNIRRPNMNTSSPSNTKHNTVKLCTGAYGHCLANPDISKLTAIQRCSQTANVTRYLHTSFRVSIFLKGNITCKRSAESRKGGCYEGVLEDWRHSST